MTSLYRRLQHKQRLVHCSPLLLQRKDTSLQRCFLKTETVVSSKYFPSGVCRERATKFTLWLEEVKRWNRFLWPVFFLWSSVIHSTVPIRLKDNETIHRGFTKAHIFRPLQSKPKERFGCFAFSVIFGWLIQFQRQYQDTWRQVLCCHVQCSCFSLYTGRVEAYIGSGWQFAKSPDVARFCRAGEWPLTIAAPYP